MTVLLALAFTLVAIGVLRWGFDHRLPGLAVVALYLVVLAVVHAIRRRRADPAAGDEPAPDLSQWPVSGPIGKLGRHAMAVPWYATNALALLNPRQAGQVAKQIAGNAALEAREKRSGNDGRDYRAKGRYTLPFHGEWLVYNGGTTPKTSHSWEILGQRFALDFLKADEAFRRHRGTGTRPEHYYSYGEPVLAAADGVVMAVENDVRTAPLVGWGVCDFTARHFAGNHVMIRHAEGEYGFYAHLILGSVAVQPGERVVRGQPIGRCGHSGHSSEPHLHFHLQDAADLFGGMGLPVPFVGLDVDGAPADGVVLRAGQRVRPREVAVPSGPT